MWGGRTAKLAPTVKSFSCSLCDFTVKNRFDLLRRHLKGKHKLGPDKLARKCAKYTVSNSWGTQSKSLSSVLIMVSVLFQDKFSRKDCGEIVANIWEHKKRGQDAANLKLARTEPAEVWTARLEQESEDLPKTDADTERVPSAAQVGKDIETTGALLKEFWRYCVRSTGTVETTASGYSRYVR